MGVKLITFTMMALSVNSYVTRLGRLRVSSSFSQVTLQCLSTPRPSDIVIPVDKIELRYSRSSGPGGQNVNKLNTKVDIRFNVKGADWLPVAVRDRIQLYNPGRVNKEGDIIVTSQEARTQAKNREDCMQKLREIISEAYVEPKDRHMWVGISDKGKAERRDEKRQRGAVKQLRKVRDFNDD